MARRHDTHDTHGATGVDADAATDHIDRTGDDDRTSHARPADRIDDAEARDKFGGLNIGAAFFGWIVAIGMAIILSSIIGAVLAAVGSNVSVTRSDAERSAGTIGIVAAIVLLVVLALAYLAGGYVAGRMSRFDGARQGVGVWAIGLVITIVAIVLGVVFGDQYNVLDRVDLPSLPVSGGQAGWGSLIAAGAVLVVTLVAAILGGVLGHRYHNRVDRKVARG